MAKRKKRGPSPTFKAGMIIILVLGMVWAYTTVSEPWYGERPATAIVSEPITMKEEVSDPEPEESTVVEEAPEPVEEAPEEAPVVPEPEPEPEPIAEVQVQLPPEDLMADSFDYAMNVNDFSTEGHYWSFRRNTEHQPVEGYTEGVDFNYFDAFYLGDTEEKVVYLTFDEGYENGYTPTILDVLKANGVQAAFFMTAPYIESQPDLVTRMKAEGHVVGNHSLHHYDGSSGDGTALYDITAEAMVTELTGVSDLMLEKTGYPMDMFFRPPALLFSEQTMYVTRQQGYKTIFCSMMYQDWYVDNQPGKEAAYDHVMTNVHPGAIILLHAVSESNTQALDDILKDLKAEGYRFGSLYELPSAY